MKKEEKVVIVGSGMAGLTAGAYLAKDGYTVQILERLDQTGGLVSTFERDGFFFDTGPRAFVNSGMVKPILRDLEIQWEELDNTIGILIEEESLRVRSLDSIFEYQKMLDKLYPKHKDEIQKIIKVITKLSKHTKVLYEFDNPYFVDYSSNKKVLFTEFIPWLFKLLFALKTFDKYGTAADEFLSKITDNKSISDVLLQMFFAKTPTYFALGYFQVYLDYFYLKGGTGTLPALVEKKYKEYGGEIILNTEIRTVIPNEKKVVDSRGREYLYDHLIWSADLKTLYKNINTIGMDIQTKEKVSIRRTEIVSSKAAESVFIMFVAVDESPNYFREITGEHSFYSPSSKGLGEVIHAKKNALLTSKDVTEEMVIDWVEEFVKYNTFEVSIPVLRDASLAPKGKTGLMISCLMDYELTKKLSEVGYGELFKKTMEDKIIEVFSMKLFRKFDKKVLFKFSTTPVGIHKISGNSEGSIVGWSFEEEAPVYNKLKLLAKTVYTPMKDIYKAGQWAYAPAGVPIAMLTGWQAVQKIKS